MSNLAIVIRREYMERVGKKSFILTTLLMPLLMVLLMVAPTLIMLFLNDPSEKTIVVDDQSGIVLPVLQASPDAEENHIRFIPLAQRNDSLDRSEYYGELTIPANIVDNPSAATLFLNESGSMDVDKTITRSIEDAVRDSRMHRYNIDNLQQILDDTDVSATLRTVRVNDNGDEESASSVVSYALAFLCTFILYMFLLMYGQQVMLSIIEEKNNRVLELMVSSVKPVHLMLGKIFGVALVAVTQIVVWGVLLCIASAFLLPALIPADVAAQAAQMQSGAITPDAAQFDTDLLSAVSIFTSVGYIAKLFLFILLFMVGGFLFYAAIFAAIGSAVENIQDASQLTSFATIPIIFALIIAMMACTDPNSSLSLWCSYIPLTSPMVMMARVPFGTPDWQTWLSLAILYLSFFGMAWVSAKIYRIGIFMYGKKPSVRDLIRWARYK